MPDGDGESVNLPRDAIVIRGGETMTLAGLQDAFEDHREWCLDEGLPPEYCISVNCVPGLDLDGLGRKARLPNKWVFRTTPDALAESGYDIRRTPDRWEARGHCDVFLQRGATELPGWTELLHLQQAFQGPIANPAAQ